MPLAMSGHRVGSRLGMFHDQPQALGAKSFLIPGMERASLDLIFRYLIYSKNTVTDDDRRLELVINTEA